MGLPRRRWAIAPASLWPSVALMYSYQRLASLHLTKDYFDASSWLNGVYLSFSFHRGLDGSGWFCLLYFIFLYNNVLLIQPNEV
jgi:hypothetical protein